MTTTDALRTLDETQVLWGTVASDPQDGFVQVTDGQEGFYHAPPIPKESVWGKSEERRRPLRLHVRHYLTEDGMTGWLRIAYSRLFDLTVEVTK